MELKQFQRMATKMIRELQSSYNQVLQIRIEEMGLFSLEKRRMAKVCNSTFQILEGNHVVKVQGLISLVQKYRAQNNS